MAWTKDNYPEEMRYLKKSVREKAIEIGNSLVESGHSKDEAITIAIAQAESWDKHEGPQKVQKPEDTEVENPSVNYYILKYNDRWGVRGENDRHPIDTFHTMDKAVERGRSLVRQTRGHLYMFKSNGTMQQIVY